MNQFLALFLFILFCLPSSDGYGRTKFKNYPHGLLTDDYGVLTEDDLWINTVIGIPSPFSDTSTGYQYWQCFKHSHIKLRCIDLGVDDDNVLLGDFEISVDTGKVLHEYGGRRGYDIQVCKDRLKVWQTLINGQYAVCFSGYAVSSQAPRNGRRTQTWIFGRLKTKAGCSSYFEGDCDGDTWRRRLSKKRFYQD